MTSVRCALCAENTPSPGHTLVVLTAPPVGKARSIYRSLPVCEGCANPSTDTHLARILSRLYGINGGAGS